MLKIVDHDLDIIVMSNGLGGLDLYTLVEAIIESCIPDLPQPEDVPAAPITGIFHSPQTGRRLALEAVGGKQAIRIDGMTLPARRDGEGRPSMPLLPIDMAVPAKRDAMASEVGGSRKNDCIRPVEHQKHGARSAMGKKS